MAAAVVVPCVMTGDHDGVVGAEVGRRPAVPCVSEETGETRGTGGGRVWRGETSLRVRLSICTKSDDDGPRSGAIGGGAELAAELATWLLILLLLIYCDLATCGWWGSACVCFVESSLARLSQERQHDKSTNTTQAS